MPLLRRLRPGMSIVDVNEHPVGTISSVLTSSFVAKIGGQRCEIGREALFSVDAWSATLLCEEASIPRYVIRCSTFHNVTCATYAAMTI